MIKAWPALHFAQAQSTGPFGSIYACGMWVLGGVALIFWLWTLVEVVRQPRYDQRQRVKWIVVITLLPILGPLLHAAIGERTKPSS